MLADTNRDGTIGFDDAAGKDECAPGRGALLLPNSDDDDSDGRPDADDEAINGPSDVDDLSQVVLTPWPEAQIGSRAEFGIDAASAPNVRVFHTQALVDVSSPAFLLDYYAMRPGVVLRLEAVRAIDVADLSVFVYDEFGGPVLVDRVRFCGQ